MRRLSHLIDRWFPIICAAVVLILLVFIFSSLSQCSGHDETSQNAADTSASTSGNFDTSAIHDAAYNASNDSSASNTNTSENTAARTFNYVDNVEELFQFPELLGGCEITSLTCMLNAMGYDVEMTDIADNYVEYGSSYVDTYSGSPYDNGGGYPPAITEAGNNYLWQQGSDVWFKDITDTDFSGLSYWLDKNVPVLVWTTMYMGEVMHTGVYEDGYEWYDNEHCVLVYAMDDDVVYVMDPMIGFVERDRETFEAIYDECGKMAVTLDI